ncbi:hypothetical protein J2Y55_003291 [Bosea sp. BE125]|nr:hypothetical protein [Bosea sp. BE125]
MSATNGETPPDARMSTAGGIGPWEGPVAGLL